VSEGGDLKVCLEGVVMLEFLDRRRAARAERTLFAERRLYAAAGSYNTRFN
jgi:hypothetical protein